MGQEKRVWFAEMAAFCDSITNLTLKAKQLHSIEKYFITFATHATCDKTLDKTAWGNIDVGPRKCRPGTVSLVFRLF